MQYSPNCAIPYVSLVDGGTVELVRSTGVEVVTSANLVQLFEARWSDEQLEMHLEAGRRVDRVRAAAFEKIGTALAFRRFDHRMGCEPLHSRRLRKIRPRHRSRPHRRGQRQHVESALRTASRSRANRFEKATPF